LPASLAAAPRSMPMYESLTQSLAQDDANRASTLTYFARGFVAMLSLWVAAIPSGIAYGVAARGVGLGALETQLMSLLVFSAAGQVGVLALLKAGAPLALAIGTVMVLNSQMLLLGLTVGRQLRPTWGERLLAAFFLTDAAFAIAASRERLRLPVLLGAGASMYIGWNAGTAIGIAAGRILLDVRGLGIDFVLPLIFLALLVPLVRTRPALVVVLVSGATTFLLSRVAPSGVAVLAAGVAASAAGAWWAHRGARRVDEAVPQEGAG
jgi:predicted branched-subunit amino acid permease